MDNFRNETFVLEVDIKSLSVLNMETTKEFCSDEENAEDQKEYS